MSESIGEAHNTTPYRWVAPLEVERRVARREAFVARLLELADHCESEDYPERTSHPLYAQGEADAYRHAAELFREYT